MIVRVTPSSPDVKSNGLLSYSTVVGNAAEDCQVEAWTMPEYGRIKNAVATPVVRNRGTVILIRSGKLRYDQRIAGLELDISGHIAPGNQIFIVHGQYLLATDHLDGASVRELVQTT
ncbi:hypothetical protein D3C79_731650 [compost metagenome]